MRYYAVVVEGTSIAFSSLVSDANNSGVLNTSGGPTLLLTSGQNNPNALRIAFSIEIVKAADQGTGSYIRLYGIPLSLMQQANTLAGKTVTLYGGFSPGLPLATAQSLGARAGMLMQGTITACYGNWRGDDVALDLLLLPTAWKGQGGGSSTVSPGAAADGGGNASTAPSARRLAARKLPSFVSPRNGMSAAPQDASISDAITSAISGDFSAFMSILATAFGGGGFRQTPVNLIHNMLPNMPLPTAIKQTLETAFPNANVKMNVTGQYKLSYQDGGFYQNMSQYAGYIKSLSSSILSGVNSSLAHQGIDLIPHNNDVIMTDWQQPTAEVMLAYTDLIGQPTWVDSTTIAFSSVLRADLYPTVGVSFPQTLFGVQLTEVSTGDYFPFSGRLTANQNPLVFNGTVLVQKVRHVGDSRSPDGQQWRTDCWGLVNSPQQTANTFAEDFYKTGEGSGSGSSTLNARFARRSTRYYR